MGSNQLLVLKHHRIKLIRTEQIGETGGNTQLLKQRTLRLNESSNLNKNHGVSIFLATISRSATPNAKEKHLKITIQSIGVLSPP